MRFKYKIHDYEITSKFEIRDFGVIFKPNLNFRPYYLSVYNSASQNLGTISRNAKHFNDKKVLKILFNSLVRSKTEHVPHIWDPHFEKHIEYLEKIQKRFLKYCYFLCHHQYPECGYPYIDLCKEFNVTSLKNRRALIQCKFIYAVINNVIDCPQIIERLLFKLPRLKARFHEQFVTNLLSTSTGYHSPLHRITKLFHETFSNNEEIDY